MNTHFRQNGLLNFILWRSSLRGFHDTTRIVENTLPQYNHCVGAILRSFCRFVAELRRCCRENYLNTKGQQSGQTVRVLRRKPLDLVFQQMKNG